VLESRVDRLGLLPTGCTIVLVADVVGTGLAADAALRSCRAGGRAADAVVALLDRRSARLVDVPLAVPALPAPSAWIAGCGMGPQPLAARPDLVTITRCPST
jgi:hypoxanthine-guanine phosphoribosyltransferase